MKLRTGFVANSSSEAFICNTKLDIGTIKRKLEELLSVYTNSGEYEKHDEKPEYDDVFGEIYIGGKSDNENFSYFHGGTLDIDGKIIIPSASDNSIPYNMFSMIEHMFNAERVHLG